MELTAMPAQPTGNGLFRRQQQQRQQRALESAREDRSHDSRGTTPGIAAVAADDLSINNSTSFVEHSQLLGIRQAVPFGCGGPETGGCKVFNICKPGFCAHGEKMSCVKAFVQIKMHPIDSEATLNVFEDGVRVCSW
jgi:hypothetical protein